jgi:glucose/mannose-6-phosphate isomerase
MINQKYFEDIQKFPSQFEVGFDLGKEIFIDGSFDSSILCGMGGSSLYVEFINDYLNSINIDFSISALRKYHLPMNLNENCLVFIVSHSGNTEETLNCLKESIERNLKFCIVASGGELLTIAKENNYSYVQIPTGIQPRLSTGYFVGSVLKILSNHRLIPDVESDFLTSVGKLQQGDLVAAKDLSLALKNKLPIIYGSEINSSIAQVIKIKFNENAKIQSFSNYFPELNHNEMVGYTNMVCNPYFIILRSKFENNRNKKRIEVFKNLMLKKGLDVKIIDLIGDSVIEEVLNVYQFMDYVTYFLAEAYGTDPEAVKMVEEFKTLINQ